MARVIQCPGCRKALKLPDSAAGKQARCPACAQRFTVPPMEPEPSETAEEQPEEPAIEEDAEEQEDPPNRRLRDREEEEEEEEPPRRRKRPRRRRGRRDRETISPSTTPLLLALLACCCSCAPLIGFGIGYYAVQQAEIELDRIPETKRYASSRTFVVVAKVLGFVGMGLSVVLLIVEVLLKIFLPLR